MNFHYFFIVGSFDPDLVLSVGRSLALL